MFTQFFIATRAWLALAVSFSVFSTFAAAPDDQPELQREPEWVDARWNQTDLGNFHAGVLPLPGGRVAKGLAIRVGTKPLPLKIQFPSNYSKSWRGWAYYISMREQKQNPFGKW